MTNHPPCRNIHKDLCLSTRRHHQPSTQLSKHTVDNSSQAHGLSSQPKKESVLSVSQSESTARDLSLRDKRENRTVRGTRMHPKDNKSPFEVESHSLTTAVGSLPGTSLTAAWGRARLPALAVHGCPVSVETCMVS